MLRALSLFAALFGAICMVMALAPISLGRAAIPGSVPVKATTDSEDRFYATLFLGYGAAMIWSSRALVPRRDVFGALLLIFFLGGIARIISALAVGLPNTLFIVLGSAELLLPPMLWALLKRAAHQAAIRRNS